jgi:hypothetical protein
VHWTKSSISKDYVSDTVPDTYEEVPAVNYSLPNGMTIEAVIGGSDYHTTSLLTNTTSTVGSSDIEWAGGLIAPRMKALSQWSFANVTIFTSNWHEDKNGFTDYVAVTCTLYPCLRSYRASVTNGKLKESLVGTSPLAPNVVPLFSTDITAEEIEQIDYPQFNAAIYGTHPGVRFQAVQSPCLVGDTIWKNTNISAVADNQPMLMLHADPTGKRRFILEKIIAPSTCIYSMDIVAWSDLESIMDSHLFNTRCDAGSYSDAGVRHMQLDCGNAFWLAKFYNATGTTAIAITEQIGAFTDRLSNKLRMGLLSQPEAVFGQVHETTVCNAINYQWLLYPTILSCCDQWTACLELSSELEAPGSRVAVEELNYTVLISRGEIRS